jgi:predicted nucleotidyltransferase
LFGSYAREEAKLGSDIDIVISFNKDAKNLYHIKSEIRDIIESKFQKKVDIANLDSIKSEYKEEILKEIIYVE